MLCTLEDLDDAQILPWHIWPWVRCQTDNIGDVTQPKTFCLCSYALPGSFINVSAAHLTHISVIALDSRSRTNGFPWLLTHAPPLMTRTWTFGHIDCLCLFFTGHYNFAWDINSYFHTVTLFSYVQQRADVYGFIYKNRKKQGSWLKGHWALER